MILDDLVKAAEEALKGDKAAISPEQMEALRKPLHINRTFLLKRLYRKMVFPSSVK